MDTLKGEKEEEDKKKKKKKMNLYTKNWLT